MKHLLVTTLSLCAAGIASAHEGHGLALPHWHASDLFGLAALAIAVAGVCWFWRSK